MVEWACAPLAWGGNLRFAAPGSGSCSCGCRLWASSLAVVGALGSKSCLSNLKVIELGAGVGAPGLFCASRGAEVVLSDCAPESLRLLRRNVSAAPAPARVEEADFTNISRVGLLGRFDLVLSTECVYEAGVAEPLIACIASLLSPGGCVILANTDRPIAGPKIREQIRKAAAKFGLSVEDLDASSYFRKGLSLSGICNDLLSGCISERLFFVQLWKSPSVFSSRDAVPFLDQMD